MPTCTLCRLRGNPFLNHPHTRSCPAYPTEVHLLASSQVDTLVPAKEPPCSSDTAPPTDPVALETASAADNPDESTMPLCLRASVQSLASSLSAPLEKLRTDWLSARAVGATSPCSWCVAKAAYESQHGSGWFVLQQTVTIRRTFNPGSGGRTGTASSLGSGALGDPGEQMTCGKDLHEKGEDRQDKAKFQKPSSKGGFSGGWGGPDGHRGARTTSSCSSRKSPRCR